MADRTFQISVRESNLPRTGNVFVVSESTGEILGKATVSKLPDTPMPFLRVSRKYFDMVNASMWKAPAVLKVVAHIMKKLGYRNLIRLKHRDVSLAVGFSARTVARCLVDLQNAGLVAHRRDLDVSTYMVNPKAVWYGSSKDLPRAVKEFIEARKASGHFVPESPADSTSAPAPDDTE